MDRKQALFFDGIRHTGEIAALAYTRLQGTLTTIATQELEPERSNELFTAAYLDAWSVVDVIDRFRALWSQLPHGQPSLPSPGAKTFAEISQPIRNLRNVADHLAQRADYVVARRGTALGVLSWFTILDSVNMNGVICTIVPGTMQQRSSPVVNPGGRVMELPTGLIELSAGEYKANLSEILPEMEFRIRDLEASLQQALDVQAPGLGQAGADLLVKMYMEFPSPTGPTNGAGEV